MAGEKKEGQTELGTPGPLKLDEQKCRLDGSTKECVSEVRKLSVKHTILTASLYLALYLPALNQTAISTALSKILAEINSDGSDTGYTWVGSSYALAQAMSLPLFGQFGHTPSRMWAFIAAMSIFMVGSSVCEAAVNIEMLLAARSVQGIGAGGISGLAISLLDHLVRVRGVGKYQELIAAAWAVVGALGPLLGGVITERAGWRWCFFINIPVGLVCTASIWMLFPPSQTNTTLSRAVKSCDLWGVGALGVGKVLVTLGLQWATQEQSWTEPATVTALVSGVCALAAFIPVELSVSKPVIPLGVFKNRSRFGSYLAAFFQSVAFSGLNYWLPLYFQGVREQSTSGSGLSMLPWTLAFSITGVLCAFIIGATKRYQETIWLGFITATMGCVLLKVLNSQISMAGMYGLLAITGVGVGPNFNSPLLPILASFDRGVADYEATRAHSATAYTFIRSLGSSIGISISGLVFFADLARHQLPTLTVFNLTQAIEAIDYLSQVEENANSKILEAAMQHIFIQVCIVMGVGLLFGLLIGRHELSRGLGDGQNNEVSPRVPRVDSFGLDDG